MISGTISSLPIAMMWTPAHISSSCIRRIILPAISIPFSRTLPFGCGRHLVDEFLRHADAGHVFVHEAGHRAEVRRMMPAKIFTGN